MKYYLIHLKQVKDEIVNEAFFLLGESDPNEADEKANEIADMWNIKLDSITEVPETLKFWYITSCFHPESE